jgi:replicative DNA helicase
VQDCERQLLAAWINGDNQDHIKEFRYFTYYPEVFRAVKGMKGEINLLTVSKASKIPVARLMKEFDYWPSLYDGCYKQKKTESIKEMLLDLARDPNSITKESVEAVYKEFETLNATHIRKPSDPCEAYKNELERRKITEPLKYGIPKLDNITGGARGQELTVIAARPRIGKSALALQFAFEFAKRKNEVLFFPLEMAAFQMMERLACRETNIDQTRLKNPRLMDETDQQALEYFFQIYKPVIGEYLHFIEKVRTISEIRRHIEHYKPKAVFIDQLTQLDERKTFKDERERFSYMTRTLKAMTMDLDVPIILLCQINRDGDGKEPTIAELKGSGSIEEDADTIIFIHQTGEAKENNIPASLIIPKQRNGLSGIKIPCTYIGNKYRFVEVGK